MTTDDIYQFGISLLDHYVLLITLALAALTLAVFLGRKSIRYAWLSLKTGFLLKRLGLKQIRNLQCPDGLGSFFTIDRLVMRHDGISVLLLKQFPGSIFCADDIKEWTQLLAGKSYRFKNPLIDLDYQVNAVSACLPGVAVDGYLFFDHQAEFPKGHPQRVIRLDSIPDSLKRNQQEKVQPSVETAWERLGTMR
ncbi:MAG: NERD domain-containing protein [Gammaproteobacteria bacterium]|nr:NERD domain-containing protein [Gammaproteobacteria bacterium]